MKNTLKRLTAVILSIGIILSTNSSVLALASDTAPKDVTFKDVQQKDWFYDSVMKLAGLRITSGMGNNMYKPNNTLTRAEFITFMCKVLGLPLSQRNAFIDMKGHWADDYVTTALNANMISFPSDGKFRPNDPITRQDAVEVMCRALGIEPDTATKCPFVDVKDNKGYITASYKTFLMNGYVDSKSTMTFKPTGKLTRAEAAKIVVNSYDYFKDKVSFINENMLEQQKKAEEEKAKQEKYQQWLSGMDKGVYEGLLTDMKDHVLGDAPLTGGKTVQEVNEYTLSELTQEKAPYWYKVTGAKNVDELANEIVRVGKKAVEIWINADYRKLDVYETGAKECRFYSYNSYYIKEDLDKIKNKTFVRQGQFLTGKGLIITNSSNELRLRGTYRYKYLEPSKLAIQKVNQWYEEEVEVTFIAEPTGLKVVGWDCISDTREVK